MQRPTLYQFFHHQLDRAFATRGLREPAEVDYVSDMLTRFAETRALYAVRDNEDRALEHLVDLLDTAREAEHERGDRARGRSVMRHLAEYALFMSGLFRGRLSARGQLAYYESQGRSAYWACADYERHPPRQHLYRRLHRDFSPISEILDHLRRVQWPLSAKPLGEMALEIDKPQTHSMGELLASSLWRR